MRHVTFLHWPLPADVVAARLPSKLVPDLREGQAWVSDTITYTARRRSPHRPHGHRFVVRPRAPLQPHELSECDHFLTGRWRAHTTVAGVLAVVPVEHQSWPLREAEVLDLEEDLFAAVGLPASGRAPVVGYSPGVDARLGPVRTVRHLRRLSDG